MHASQKLVDADLGFELTDDTARSRISRENDLLARLDSSRMMIRQLAHEIKNPLGGIRGAAQLLESELTSPQQTEYTQVIISEADRLQSLVNRLLTPHRLPAYTRVNIHEILARVILLGRAELLRDRGRAHPASRSRAFRERPCS